MKKFLVLCSGLLAGTGLWAQLPEDAIKFSWFPQSGSARSIAIGGAMGSLGGDISATFVNPAGLGFYKTSDFALSPGFSFLNNKSNFRGTGAKDNKSNFNFGTSGFVFGWSDRYGKWSGKAFGLAVTRTADFNSNIYYKGQNNFSSYGEQYAAEAAASGLSLDDILNSTSVSLGTRMAVYSYLVDTATLNGNANPDLISMAMRDNLKNGAPFLVDQEKMIRTSGGITEPSLGFAANMDDKFYIGGSLGIPIVSYTKNATMTETDATGNNDNDFASSSLQEKFTTKGAGLNLKLGVIFKPANSLRIGIAAHSPTWYGLKDTYSATMTTNTENYPPSPGLVTVSSEDVFTNGQPASYKYDLQSPWKVMVSGAFVLHEVEDVRNQKGFLTADIEYVDYSGNRFRTADQTNGNSYYDAVNKVMKDYYKGAFNFRAGGELKFTTVMARLGFAYYGSPYRDKALKANQMFISGGLGYRNRGFFVDLSYRHALEKDVNFPYRLPDKANTFASIKGSGGTVILTLGIKI